MATETPELKDVREWCKSTIRLVAAGQAAMTMTAQEAVMKVAIALSAYDRLMKAMVAVSIRLAAGPTEDAIEWATSAIQEATGQRIKKLAGPRLLVQPIDPAGKYLLFSEEMKTDAELEAIAQRLSEWYQSDIPIAIVGLGLALYRVDHGQEEDDSPQD